MKSILCFLGIHDWAEIEAKPVQFTGLHILFFTWGIQRGTKKCQRCQKTKHLVREGFVGSGCKNPKWKTDYTPDLESD
jgi:hypothetical protein